MQVAGGRACDRLPKLKRVFRVRHHNRFVETQVRGEKGFDVRIWRCGGIDADLDNAKFPRLLKEPGDLHP